MDLPIYNKHSSTKYKKKKMKNWLIIKEGDARYEYEKNSFCRRNSVVTRFADQLTWCGSDVQEWTGNFNDFIRAAYF